MPETMLEKIWNSHQIANSSLIYIDLHLLHEVTSPQAFEGLRLAQRPVRRPDKTLATSDHSVPTDGSTTPAEIRDLVARKQVETLTRNCHEFGVPFYGLDSDRQGIVHVIGPELGLTQPGMTIVCGDSHTSTHGAFGALAFGIGTSEVEHVLATQCLNLRKPLAMRINFVGEPSTGISAKDLILAAIGQIGVSGATGHIVEYTGPAIRSLSMEGRMTICNMTIEAGGRAGMIAPDETTVEWVESRTGTPAPAEWLSLGSDEGARFDRSVDVDVSDISPQVTWGTTPEMVTGIDRQVPPPTSLSEERALAYMDLEPGTPLADVEIDRVFIGSCTNSRIEDLRAAARLAEGLKVTDSVKALVVPGSRAVKAQAEREGLDRIFKDSGFEWRDSGCSMCVGMNPDVAGRGERVASTSNRNFEGRQGAGARTHLMSPEMAVASAVTGHLSDPRDLLDNLASDAGLA